MIRGAGYDAKHRNRNECVVRECAPDGIAAIVDLLAGAHDDGQNAFMEWPVASFVFLNGGHLVCELGLLSGGAWIRGNEAHDLRVAHPAAVNTWLLERGLDLTAE